MARRETWLDQVGRKFQLDSRMLTRAEAANVLPGLSGEFLGGLYTPSDGRAQPQKAAPAIARAAQRHGAKIVTQCAVRGIETQGGRVSAVMTSGGGLPVAPWCWRAGFGRGLPGFACRSSR